MTNCIICDSNKSRAVFTEQGIDILRCSECGHVYSSFEAEDNYGGYFKEDIEKADHFWWREAHERMYDDFQNRFMLRNSGRLFDVGCGLGYFMNQVGVRAGWEIYGSEISEPAVRFARKNLRLKNIFLGKAEDSGYPENYFDIITMWDVIEHIPNPRSLLKYLRTILKDDGMLFLHTPNINVQLPKARIKKFVQGEKRAAHYLEAGDHINIYSPTAIKKLLAREGFGDIKLIHLYPIQSAAGSSSLFLKTVKNIWFYTARALDWLSNGSINIDNLFVVAKK